MRHLGGIPVRRSKHMNSTERIVREATEMKEFRLCITPEGTRKPNPKWRTGFYYIALGAKLPILLYGVDFERKLIQCTKTVIPTGNIEEDMKEIKAYFKDFKGKKPEKFAL
jgi:1-acyl-sn-glycerol-3-phosphate acyltransferase